MLLSNLRAARVLSSTCTCIIIIIIIYSINPLGTVWCKLFYIETFPQIANTSNAITGVKIKYYSYHFFYIGSNKYEFLNKNANIFLLLKTVDLYFTIVLISISLLF